MGEIYGWIGNILRVDLTKGTAWIDDTKKYSKRFIGGRGIAAKIAWDEIPPGIDAFDPENRLIIMTGPLTGTAAPGTGRVMICGVAPQTYPRTHYTRSSMGGSFGPALKYSGFDGVVIYGKSLEPVYIFAHDGRAELMNSKDLWGLDIFTAQELLMERHGGDTRSITMGQAGENLVRFAIIANETENAAGQGGFGAVMGSKNVKAVAVKGGRGVKIANPDEFLKAYRHIVELLPEDEKRLPKLKPITGNYRSHLKTIKGVYRQAYTACEGCPNYCGAKIIYNVPGRIHPGLNTALAHCDEPRWWEFRHWDIPDETYKNFYPELPKPEEIPAIDNFESIFEIKILGDRYGLNMKEIHEGILPWIMSCKDTGIITDEEFGMKIDLSKGDFWDALFRKIVYREGIGKVLGEGVSRAADILGKGHRYITHVAYGFPEHHVGRGINSSEKFPFWVLSGLAWITDSRDPCSSMHEVNWGGRTGTEDPLSPERITKNYAEFLSKRLYGTEKSSEPTYLCKSSRVIWHQNRSCLKETLVLCENIYPLMVNRRIMLPGECSYSPNILGDTAAEAKLFSAATGIEVSEEDMNTVGERVFNLERAIMVKEGRTRESECSSGVIEYLRDRPDTDGIHLDKLKFLKALDEYYTLRGWNAKKGWPKRETLERLNLKDVADALEKRGLLP